MNTGERIKDLLITHGMSQKELAERIGVTEKSICLYVRRNKLPNTIILAKIARELHTTVDYLLGCETEEINEDVYIKTLRNVKNHTKNWTPGQKAQLVNAIFGI